MQVDFCERLLKLFKINVFGNTLMSIEREYSGDTFLYLAVKISMQDFMLWCPRDYWFWVKHHPNLFLFLLKRSWLCNVNRFSRLSIVQINRAEAFKKLWTWKVVWDLLPECLFVWRLVTLDSDHQSCLDRASKCSKRIEFNIQQSFDFMKRRL